MKSFLKKPFARGAGNEGLTIVAVLVALFLLSLATALAVRGFNGFSFARQAIQSSTGLRDVETSLRLGLVNTLKEYIAITNCNSKFTVDRNFMGGKLQLFDKDVPDIGTAGNSSMPTNFNAQAAALQRCKKSRLPKNGTEDADFYFCLEISPNAPGNQQSSDSFMAGKGVFAEVRAVLEDVGTGKNISCTAFNNGGAARLFYAVHWHNSSVQGQIIHQSKLGFTYVPSH